MRLKRVTISVFVFLLSGVGLASHAKEASITCVGDASASIEQGVERPDTLNPRGEMFSIQLNEGDGFFIGEMNGPCGSYGGCYQVFKAWHRIINIDGKIVHFDRATATEKLLFNGSYQFYIDKYPRRLSLQCTLNIASDFENPTI